MTGAAVYVDASAAVKLFVDDDDAPLARATIEAAPALIGSRLLRTEVGAALHRRIDPVDRSAALEGWDRLWASFDVVEVDAHIADHALALAQFHALGTLDAVHLATALRVPAVPMVFVTWDRMLAAAARAVGLRTVPKG